MNIFKEVKTMKEEIKELNKKVFELERDMWRLEYPNGVLEENIRRDEYGKYGIELNFIYDYKKNMQIVRIEYQCSVKNSQLKRINEYNFLISLNLYSISYGFEDYYFIFNTYNKTVIETDENMKVLLK